MAINDPCEITLPRVRLSYAHLLQPVVSSLNRNDPDAIAKYGSTLLLDKADTQSKAKVDAAIAAAIEKGVANPKCWNGVRPPRPMLNIHDGDGGRPTDGLPYGDECKGQWVITANNRDKPGLYDRYLNEIIDPREIYSGMYAAVSLRFYPYNNRNKGIGIQLNHVMKVADGEPLGGGTPVKAEDAFADLVQSFAAQAPAPAQGGYGAQPQPQYGQDPALGNLPPAPQYIPGQATPQQYYPTNPQQYTQAPAQDYAQPGYANPQGW